MNGLIYFNPFKGLNLILGLWFFLEEFRETPGSQTPTQVLLNSLSPSLGVEKLLYDLFTALSSPAWTMWALSLSSHKMCSSPLTMSVPSSGWTPADTHCIMDPEQDRDPERLSAEGQGQLPPCWSCFLWCSQYTVGFLGRRCILPAHFQFSTTRTCKSFSQNHSQLMCIYKGKLGNSSYFLKWIFLTHLMQKEHSASFPILLHKHAHDTNFSLLN